MDGKSTVGTCVPSTAQLRKKRKKTIFLFYLTDENAVPPPTYATVHVVVVF
jgi:hypothetical protein